MHEMSIAVELIRQLETLADEHGADRIEAVTVSAGIMQGVVPEALDMAFTFATEGTRAEGATLTLEVVPAVARCRVCGHRFEPEPDSFLCQHCRQADVEFVQGNEILLTSVTCSQEEGASPDEED